MILLTGSGAIAEAYAKLFPCRIVSARLMDNNDLADQIRSCKAVIHNAACISADNLLKYLEGNFIQTKRILDLAASVNPDMKFINISSMSVLETAENYKQTGDMTDYALSKYLAEIYCINHQFRNLTSVRFSTVFYKNPARDGLSKLAHDAVVNKKIEILNDGKDRRDFIPIEIAAQYLHKLTEKDELPRTINIVSGRPLSFRHFVDIIVKKVAGTKVSNKEFKVKEVLHSFKKDGISYLGELPFDIDLAFSKYLDDLYETVNL